MLQERILLKSAISNESSKSIKKKEGNRYLTRTSLAHCGKAGSSLKVDGEIAKEK